MRFPGFRKRVRPAGPGTGSVPGPPSGDGGEEEQEARDDPLFRAVVAYFNAPTELQARISLRNHGELLAAAVQKLAAVRAPFSISGVGEVGNARARLLQRCLEIGISSAFFEAFQGGSLPFSLESPGRDNPTAEDSAFRLTAEFESALQRVTAAEDAYHKTPTMDALTELVSSWEYVVSLREFGNQTGYIQGAILNQTGVHRLNRFGITGDRDDVDAAIVHWRRATSDVTLPRVADYFGNLGNAYQQKLERFGNLADLDSAMAAHIDAIDLTAVNSPDLHRRQGNLGNSLWYRYELTGAFDDLKDAGDSLAIALADSPPDAPERPGHLNNLADIYVDFADHSARAGDPEQAVKYIQEAVELARQSVSSTPDDSRDLPRHLFTLSKALTIRAVISSALSVAAQEAEDWEEATRAAERSVALTQPGSHEFVTRQRQVAALAARKAEIASSAAQGSLADPSEYYRRSVASGLAANPSATISSAISWGRWAARGGRWHEAAEAYAAAVEAMTAVFDVQQLRAHKENALKDVQELPGEAAFAFAMDGDVNGAIDMLERGRALLLSEALDRQAVNGQQLRDAGESQLAECYETAQQELATLELELATDPLLAGEFGFAFAGLSRNLGRLEEKSGEFERLRARAREVLGLDTSFSPAAVTDVISVSSVARPIVYFVATLHGGVALIAAGEHPKAVMLPAFRADELKKLVNAYLSAHADRGSHHWPWLQTIDRVTSWLWSAVVQPLLEEFHEVEYLVAVPVGLLGLLPLHAAWCLDSSTTTGRRYLLDEFGVVYAPNVRLFREAELRAEALPDDTASDDTASIVVDPRPSAGPPLPNADHEAGYVGAAFAASTEIKGTEASRVRIMRLLGERDHVLHLACHARADTVDPLMDCLMLAHGEQLTLRDVLKGGASSRRLVVLSACETAVINATLANEVIGLNTGFLQAGAAGVIGSLWSVPDASTAMLMKHFYACWRRGGQKPAEALRLAQLSIRDATNAENHEAFPELAALAEPSASEKSRALWEKANRYAHPYYWAAFTYLGA